METILLPVIVLACSSLFAVDLSISVAGKSPKGELRDAEKERLQLVFILSGSGPTDRDGNTPDAPGKHEPELTVAGVTGARGVELEVEKAREVFHRVVRV